MATRLAEAFIARLARHGWLSWERRTSRATVLMVTNAWPRPDKPMLGVFLRYTVDSLQEAGVCADVLYVRGDRGKLAYVLGALALLVLPLGARGRYRLVHSHGGETALLARMFWGAPVLASYWGSDILGVPAGSRRLRASAWLRARVLRLHALSLTATTTKSREMEGVLPERARRRNWVIPDGVDRARFAPGDRAAARARLGWPAEEITVISVGRRVPLKRVWLAEQAVELAARDIAGLRWRLISDASPEEMPLYYNAAHALIHTSASEGSPNAVKEALACDLPVVATPAGDIPELLEGVEPSAVCRADPAALAQALVRCLRAGRPSNGRQRSERVGLEAVARQTLACYASLERSSAQRGIG